MKDISQVELLYTHNKKNPNLFCNENLNNDNHNQAKTNYT